nr:PREDICTED: LOW QUALITY PROTEIN: inactive serine/threonine-protein kinase PLK5 [Camelus bactrianus]
MYTELTGVPPFVAAPLSEMYQNIREGRYPEPAHLSPSARRLIARLLAPDPAERPSLDHLLQDDFFTQGFTLDRLPPPCCHSPPVFTIPPPLGRLFRKVGRLLLAQCWPPCPFTPTEASGPGEDGSDPDSMEWGSEASLSESRVLCPERPIHLLTQGTLRSDPAGPEQSPRQEVEAAIRNLRLCLDSGPPAVQDPPGERRPVRWAPEWVDYSSKYGFGYQLSDGGRRPASGWHPHGSAPPRGEGGPPLPAPPAGPGLCLLRFVASEGALLLLFSDGSVQVSCCGNQSQLVLSGGGEALLLTVWEQGQPGTSYSLAILRSHGCAPAARQHLQCAVHMLQSI